MKKKGAIIAIIVVIVLVIGGIFVYRTNAVKSLRQENITRVEKFDTSQFTGKDLEKVEQYISDAQEEINQSSSQEEMDSIIKELEKKMDEVRRGKPSTGSADSEGCID